MVIRGSCDGDGLGDVLWWKANTGHGPEGDDALLFTEE